MLARHDLIRSLLVLFNACRFGLSLVLINDLVEFLLCLLVDCLALLCRNADITVEKPHTE